MKHSLQWRLAGWFAASLCAVAAVFAALTILQLRYELRVEQWRRAHPQNPDFVLHGTYSEDEIQDIAGHILNNALLLSAPVALVALLLGHALARRSLRPIAALNRQLEAIDAERLDARVVTPAADLELDALTRSLNGLLDRVGASYRDASEFSARVAHELRTPLTLMRLQLEESAAKIEPDLAEHLQDELRRLEGYVEQCLLLARAERGQLAMPHAPVDLVHLLGDVLEPFKLLARAEGRAIESTIEVVPPVAATGWAVRQILHNLLINALRHGEGPVRIRLARDAAGVVLSVANTVAPTRSAGTGLGLRTVAALVRADGILSFAVDDGGATYTARLRWPEPLAAVDAPQSGAPTVELATRREKRGPLVPEGIGSAKRV